MKCTCLKLYFCNQCNLLSFFFKFWFSKFTLNDICGMLYVWGGLLNERERTGGVDCPGVNEAIIIQPPGSLSGFFWSATNKTEIFISACQPSIYSDCSGYCLTLPIDSSTYFLIGFLTASQIVWLIALPPALSSAVWCVCFDMRGVLRDA